MVASVGSTFADANGNSYKVVLSDDFSAGYKTDNWGYAYNGGTYWNGAFTWSSADVNVRNGEMQVTDTRHDDGSWTAGGFNSNKSDKTITYGTIEFDARVEQAQGTQAAILFWPVSDVWPRDGELDTLETPKTVAMHSSHWEGDDGSHQYSSIFSSIDPGKTHHYVMTWLPTSVTIKVDGQTVASWTDDAAVPDTAMGFGAMGYVAADGEEWLGGAPNGSTPSVVTTHIDNVVMSQWTGTVTPPSGSIPAQFGTPGTWGEDSKVFIGQVDFGGTKYQTFGGTPAWGSLSTVQTAPKTWDASWDTHIAVDNFVTANLDLRAAGVRALDVMMVSAKSGDITLGNGNDLLTWVAHSDAKGSGNTMTIKTGSGDDTVYITAAGLSSLADYDKTDNGSLYNANYDGTGSTAVVKFGAGHDTVSVEGGVRLSVSGGTGFATATGGKANDAFYAGTGGGSFTGGAGKDAFIFDRGDGHITINDFTSGTDQLRFRDLTRADVSTNTVTEAGVSGLLITYDSNGDSVFLRNVSKIATADMVFA